MYSYNKETLQFEPNKNFKKIILIIIFLLIGLCLTLSSAISKNKMISQLEAKSKTQHKIINVLQNKPKDSAEEYKFFRSSLGKSIDPTKQEENRLKHLYFKYKDLINAYKVPHNLVWYKAFKESRLNPNAKNGVSSAKGMFQFIDQTWKGMCKKGGLNLLGRMNEAQQVEVMCIYLNYLYDKYGNWERVHNEYCGGVITYNIPKLSYIK
jgi:hypothetical protein